MAYDMNKINTLPQNVKDFWEKCADEIAQDKKYTFLTDSTDILATCDSPIEQLFYLAMVTESEVTGFGKVHLDFNRYFWIEGGIDISAQVKIGKYIVDFVIKYAGTQLIDAKNFKTHNEKKMKSIVVELDGHEFHDKNEKQRRYEKKRDRFLQKQGYKVFHYTGTEIFLDPFAAAQECLAYLTEEENDTQEDQYKR